MRRRVPAEVSARPSVAAVLSSAEPHAEAGVDTALQRRRFLRGGALLAAAAGGAVAATVSPGGTPVAAAADGDVLHAGAITEAGSTTTLSLVDNPGAAALRLTNPNGAALLLDPSVRGFSGKLPVGGLAATPGGVLVGLEDDDDNPYTSYLVSAPDLARIPITVPFVAARVLNTKDDATLDAILDRSLNALDSKNRLRKGAWIDVMVLPNIGEAQILGAFLTLTSVGSTAAGSMTVCSPTFKPDKIVTLPFDKGRTVATGTLAETALVKQDNCVRVYATATTHLKLDVTGFTLTTSFGGTPNVVTGPDQAVTHAIKGHLKSLNARARY